jgi:type IV pilus assembly protein PilX
MNTVPCLSSRTGRPQRGASLLFALLTLAAMSLAAVALVRSVDTASLLAGNLGQKQSSVAVSGHAAEEAIRQLVLMRAASQLDAVQAGQAYYPIAYENLDPTDKSTVITRAVVDWEGNGCASYTAGTFGTCLSSRQLPGTAASDLTQNARYVITRLCGSTGAPSATNFCAKPVSQTLNEGASRTSFGYPSGRNPSIVDPGPYYRIIVRVTGTRNTMSYTETIVHF